MRRDETERGESRRFNDPKEKARKAVSKAIREAISKLKGENAVVAEHLDWTIELGDNCSYRPPSEIAVKWE